MYDSLITTFANKYGVPDSWIRAVIETESSWNARAFRDEPQIEDASRGLMQILLSTAEGLGFRGDPEDLFDPGVNIDLGTRYLAQLRSQYGEDFRDIYSAYNSGDPGLWERSSQVYNNVYRAVVALEKYAKTPLPESPGYEEPAPGSPSIWQYGDWGTWGLVIAAGLILVLIGKR